MNTPRRMKLAHWPYELVDLDRDALVAKKPHLSVLANSVEHLNARLLGRLAPQTRLLEIGCGTYSLLKQAIQPPQQWEGIDVAKHDRKGTPTIATQIASVHAIPWPSRSFDYVVSNQSIEHWHEYGVPISKGLAEIHRVLVPGGRAILNFPIHLHGHQIFLQGRFHEIDRAFLQVGFSIERRTAVVDTSHAPYPGWRLCGFPDFLVSKTPNHEETSFVVEYEMVKVGNGSDEDIPPRTRSSARLSTGARHLHYGVPYLIWKVANRMIGRRRARLDGSMVNPDTRM